MSVDYNRFKDHPVRRFLKRAASGSPFRRDELDDLGLPAEVRSAVTEAVRRVGEVDRPNQRNHQADQYAQAIVEDLYRRHPDWESPVERDDRRASFGDVDALARIRAREEATGRLVDDIQRGF